MREIKFRGFYACEDEDEQIFIDGELVKGAWVYGYVWKNDRGQFFITEYNSLTMYPVIPETVGQYTNLKDKNEIEIYESDILKYTFDNPGSVLANENGLKVRIDTVFWSEWRSSFALGSRMCNNDLFKYVRNGNRVEVIGNIYNNPKLLESEE